ncbi:MAG: hypothetical protein C0601_05135 [Candidatus Muiribacterium halophilum]|uniref:Uncharacterized protein n=1 Tax=Muiribacterium halophilum TaxID=2053465 RepID=A0A2N5ZIE6_MUIH1|nr:MAG: hypothetical protein C0601_05135 [Candidatus Muirbacterium halophilum]
MPNINSLILKKEIDQLMHRTDVLRKFHGNHSYFIGWRKDVEIFLYVAFGKQSESLKKFCKIHYFPQKSGEDEKKAYNKGLDAALDILMKERTRLPEDKMSDKIVKTSKKNTSKKHVITTLVVIIIIIIYILLAYGRMIG